MTKKSFGALEMKLHHLDLFSGIGGFSLGLESTGGFQTVGFCEIEDYPRRVLKRHWPEVTCFEDIGDNGWLSLSGLIDSRQARGAHRDTEQPHISPDWIIIENEGHRWRRWVPELRRELWARGYASLPIRVRADWFGFPHRRARVFLVANPDGLKLWQLSGWWSGQGRQMAAELAKPEDYAPRGLGTDDGVSNGIHRRRAIGNAVVPQIVAAIGRAILAVEKEKPRST